jgi:hypothetical protein
MACEFAAALAPNRGPALFKGVEVEEEAAGMV